MNNSWKYKLTVGAIVIASPILLVSMMVDTSNSHKCHKACIQKASMIQS